MFKTINFSRDNLEENVFTCEKQFYFELYFRSTLTVLYDDHCHPYLVPAILETAGIIYI